MAAIDDLNTAVAAVQAAATAAVTDIQNLVAAGNQDAAIETAVTTLNGIATNLQAAVAPPAPPPAAAPPV